MLWIKVVIRRIELPSEVAKIPIIKNTVIFRWKKSLKIWVDQRKRRHFLIPLESQRRLVDVSRVDTSVELRGDGVGTLTFGAKQVDVTDLLTGEVCRQGEGLPLGPWDVRVVQSNAG